MIISGYASRRSLVALGHPVPTLLPEGEGSFSPLPLGEGKGEGSAVSIVRRDD